MSINYLEKITEVYLFVSVDEGGEGIIGKQIDLPNGKTFMPFVASDKERLDILKVMTKQIVKETGQQARLIKLTNREVIEEYL